MSTTSLKGAGWFCAALCAAVCAANPQGLRASGYEFDGVGARSVARGGAVIADAPDWTAIYWNPANLTAISRRESGMELRAGGMTTKDSNSLNVPGVGSPFDKTTKSSNFLFGAAGAAFPINKDSALAAGFYTPLMQGARFKDDAVNPPGSLVLNSINYRAYTVLGVGNISYARNISGKFSAALGMDVIYGRFNSRAITDISHITVLPGNPGDVQKVKLDGSGYGLEGVFGVKYAFKPELSFGAVFRTGSKFRVKGDATARSYADPFGAFPDEASDFHILLKHPATSGVGAAWQAKKDLKLSCDFTQTWWRGFSNELTYSKPGTMLANTPNSFDWKNSYKFRAGALWAYGEKTDLMFGYAFDTPAIDKGSIDFSTAVDVPMHRFSAAVSRRFGELQATLGALAGSGTRKEGSVRYELGGWYLMSEARYNF